MNRSKHSFGWMRLLCTAAAAALLMTACFAAMAAVGCGPASTQTADADKPQQSVPALTEEAQKTDEAEKTNEPPMGYIADDEVVYNRFLTAVVQQNIENTDVDLDDDAELVRFVFGYLKYYQADSIVARQNEDGAECRTLTLEQVNETLSTYFERTVDPDREDYSILDETGEGFRCVYRDGCFWNEPPYPEQRFDFPVRFALVDRINTKNNTLHFRLYRMNPDAWEEGEAERHVPVMPMLSLYEAEFTNDATKDWITKIGEGTALLTELGEDMKLLELKCKLY